MLFHTPPTPLPKLCKFTCLVIFCTEKLIVNELTVLFLVSFQMAHLQAQHLQTLWLVRIFKSPNLGHATPFQIEDDIIRPEEGGEEGRPRERG